MRAARLGLVPKPSARPDRCVAAALLVVAAMALLGCAHGRAERAASMPAPPAPAETTVAPQSKPVETASAESFGLERRRIAALQPGEAIKVRIQAKVVESGQIRMVPPQTVFTVSDGSGSTRVMIAERRVFPVGTNLELVGTLAEKLPGEESGEGTDVPGGPIFVVERYLELPEGAEAIPGIP